MSRPFDPELDDLFSDEDLRATADLISRAAPLEAEPDPAFRSQLRRNLLREGWSVHHRRPSLWRRLFAGPGLALSGAAVGAALIAVVAISFATSRPGQIEKVTIGSPLADARQVSLAEPITINFNAAMDQQSVERAITISPATQVSYQWVSPTTVRITPVSGDLAPNTQYQVKVAASAATVTHQGVVKPQTFVFITQPAPIPTTKPATTPSPQPVVGSQRVLAPLPDGGLWYQVAPDGASVYFLGQGGSINSVPLGGGSITTLVPDGASGPSLSPDGTQLAYLRDGRPQILGTRDSKPVEFAGQLPVLGWIGTRPVSLGADGSLLAGNPPVRIGGPLPAGSVVTSVSPAGDRLVYRLTNSVHLFEPATGKDVSLGTTGTTFAGWSQDGRRAIYGGQGGFESADLSGQPAVKLGPAPDSTLWPAAGQVLLVTGGNLVTVNPEGTLFRTLAPADFQAPVLGLPDGSGAVFNRAGSLWLGRFGPAGNLAPGPNLDAAARVMSDFMKARLARDRAAAEALMSAAGKAAYAAGGPLSLIGPDDSRYARWFAVYAGAGAGQTVNYKIRLVTSRPDGRDATLTDESLLLRQVDDRLLVDQAAAGPGRPAGQGPEVISVQVSNGQIQVGFDSDLEPGALTQSFTVTVGAKAATVQPSYDPATRTVRLAVTGLVPGQQYRLAVAAGLKDVAGRALASEFDLDLTAPAA